MIDNTKKTEQQVKRELEFRDRFVALLREFGATFECADHWTGYPECGEDIQARVWSCDEYDSEGNVTVPGMDFDLGKYIDPN